MGVSRRSGFMRARGVVGAVFLALSACGGSVNEVHENGGSGGNASFGSGGAHAVAGTSPVGIGGSDGTSHPSGGAPSSACELDRDCPDSKHCQAGTCAANVCVPLEGTCSGTTLVYCDQHGARFLQQACSVACTTDPATCLGASSGGEGGAIDVGGAPGAGGEATAGDGGDGGDGGEAGERTTCTGKAWFAPACGTPGAPSPAPYGGVQWISFTGVTYNSPTAPDDAFYQLDPNDTTKSIGTCPSCVVYNRASEGSCVCPSECPTTSHPFSAILTHAYPAFNPEHLYIVQVDFGTAPPETLNLAFGDCGCTDNSGGYVAAVCE